MKLDEYRKKRDPAATPEPFPSEAPSPGRTTSGAYVVHLHEARRTHYDLRLEVSGALESFAVPKGPSLDPGEKRLAVRTEPHPLEYLDFEAVIPAGQYGAGPMIAWDTGRVQYIGAPAEEQLEKGKLEFELSGHKLHGRFLLVHVKSSEKDWLLFKRHDAFAAPGSDIIQEKPRSVLSGLGIEELSHADEIASALAARAAELGAKHGAIEPDMIPMRASAGPLLEFCRQRRLEGLIAKRARSPYRPGPLRSADWIKLKSERDEDFVVVGYTLGEGARHDLGAIDVASYENGGLVYRGKVGSGFDEPALADLLARLRPLRQTLAVTTGPYPVAPRGRVHVKPEVVVSVRFSGFTDDGKLRFPVFRGVREDVAPEECTAAPNPDPETAEVELEQAIVPEKSAPISAQIKIEKPDKILFPEIGLTKKGLADYYAAVADVLLPHLKDRPVMLVRYPNGIHEKSFYQWNVPAGTPAHVQTREAQIPGRDERTQIFDVRDVPTLLYLANLAAIPIHILAARAPHLTCSDFLTIDLDVSGGTFAQVIELARSLHSVLGQIGLVGYPKTSGQSGLHVFVPLGPSISYDTARSLADLLGHLLVRRHPAIATMERMKRERGARVYIDTGQTGPSRTIVAPYAVRAVPLGTVSTPLRWEEVSGDLDPRVFDVHSVPRRVALRGDPMAAMYAERPNVLAAAEKLEALFRREKR